MLVSQLVGKGNRVLDVGCGEGALSARIAEAGNEVVSIEQDARMAEKASALGLNVLTRNLERDSIDDLGDFDVIVCADVLEHLLDPSVALLTLGDHLGRNGRLVCSIPNIGFYTVRLKLLLGKFEYADGGILDRTHLRFFTHKTSRALLEGANFRIRREEISQYLPLGSPFLTRVVNDALESGSLGRAVHNACLVFPGFFAYQFVTESVRDNRAE
jgi:2-polyprenyl-3-methyl-5-hydroxy-6-metoxy-1,4-benzoquinol methylase